MIDGDAEWSADFVLSSIPSTDCAAVVIENREMRPQAVGDFSRHLGHAVLFHEGEHTGLDRSKCRTEAEDDSSFVFSLDCLLPVPIYEQREQSAIGADRRLHYKRNEPLVGGLLEVLELLA